MQEKRVIPEAPLLEVNLVVGLVVGLGQQPSTLNCVQSDDRDMQVMR